MTATSATARAARRRWVTWMLFAGAAATLSIVALTFVFVRPSHLRAATERAIKERLGLDASVGHLRLTMWPQPTLVATAVTLRDPRHPELAPFIRIARMDAAIGPLSVWRGRVDRVDLSGLAITVPPRREGGRTSDTRAMPPEIVVDRLEARDATLTLLRKQPDHDPLVFRIHELRMRQVGFDRVVSYEAVLTNPVPVGRVETSGWIGPWNRQDPTNVALRGGYLFHQVDLDTIKGIGGGLTSTGRYQGQLTRIAVAGSTRTTDFQLDLGARAMPLATTFRATVDASDGTTVLERVDATLNDTPMRVRGRVDNLPGPDRRAITLDVTIDNGHVEDVMSLVLSQPTVTGQVSLTAAVELPPGDGHVIDRLKLHGRFTLPTTDFTHPASRAAVTSLSRRSRDGDGSTDAVLADIDGCVHMINGVITFPWLRFRVPGARVQLGGRYEVTSSALDLTGTVRMDTTLSRAAGGVKGMLLRPFDWLFARDGAGAVLPITIRGRANKPEVGVSIRRMLTGNTATGGRARCGIHTDA